MVSKRCPMLEPTLSTTRIHVNVEAQSKKRVLEKIVELCAHSDDKKDWFLALIEREKLGSTGLGHGVALPHARIPGITAPMACFIKLDSPVDFGSPDGEPVDLIFGLFVPEKSNDTHLQILASVAERFNSDVTRSALRQANSAELVYDLLTDADNGVNLAS